MVNATGLSGLWLKMGCKVSAELGVYLRDVLAVIVNQAAAKRAKKVKVSRGTKGTQENKALFWI